MVSTEITSWEDIIDSRQVIERIAELSDDDYEIDEHEARELEALRKLAEQGSDFEDWEHGVILVRDSYFIDFAQQEAEELGMIDSNAEWPMRHIDWEAAANELQMDYTSIDFAGVTYWAR